MNHFPNLVAALEAAPGERSFVTHWIDEDDCNTATFAQFRERARAQAALLREHGVKQNDRVVLIMPQGIEAMTAFVGAMMLGAIPAFLAYPNFKVEAAKYRTGLAGVTANLNARLVLIDETFPDDLLDHVAVARDTHLLRAQASTAVLESFATPQLSPASVAFIQHSAGTTGLQKGVALTHAAVLQQIEHLASALQVNRETDSIYSWLPLYHDMGLTACFMLPMVCHLPVVMQSPLDWVMQPESMLQVITGHKCTLTWLPNFAFQFLPRRVPQSRWSQYDLSSVRAFINCSEPVRPNSMTEFLEAFASIGVQPESLQSSYAMAENVFAVTQSSVSQPPSRVSADPAHFRASHEIVPVSPNTPGAMVFISSGQLLPNVQLRILSDSGAILEDGHVGEILIKSDCLFHGYYNRPDLSAEAIVDGWYRTGDLGFYLERELYVIGRKKDLIIVGGENLYPQDIEDLAAAHPAIHDGRVVAMPAYNPGTGTDDILVVAEVEAESLLQHSAAIELEIRNQIVRGMGVAVRTILLKPPRWIVKSTAGKPARAATRAKLAKEHPELNLDTLEHQLP